jgi:hypothetical protein
MGYEGPGAGEYIEEGDETQDFLLPQRADQLPLSIHEDIGRIAVDQMPCPTV